MDILAYDAILFYHTKNVVLDQVFCFNLQNRLADELSLFLAGAFSFTTQLVYQLG